jgi:phosphohistidine phosphatase SixA
VLALPGAAGASEALWALLRGGGQVVLIRHAVTTPGVGDPAGMRLDDCATQRNLSDEGRRHARLVGEAFRARGIPVDRVLSSPWCRCLETARLAFGSAEPWAPLGNLYGRPERRDAQVREMRALVGQSRTGSNLVLVSHGSTISALTGVSPGTAEIVVVTPGGDGRFAVAGRLTVHDDTGGLRAPPRPPMGGSGRPGGAVAPLEVARLAVTAHSLGGSAVDYTPPMTSTRVRRISTPSADSRPGRATTSRQPRRAVMMTCSTRPGNTHHATSPGRRARLTDSDTSALTGRQRRRSSGTKAAAATSIDAATADAVAVASRASAASGQTATTAAAASSPRSHDARDTQRSTPGGIVLTGVRITVSRYHRGPRRVSHAVVEAGGRAR